MIISLSGLPGAGKGTVGRLLAKQLGYKYVCGGDMLRRIAQNQYQMTMEEFDEYLLEHPEIKVDQQIDNLQKEMGEKEDNFILDSRLGWYFVPQSFKVLLKADLNERARRILNDNTGKRIASQKGNFEKIKQETIQRERTHQKRITQLYGIENMVDEKHYDLIIDTTNISPEKVAEIILNKIS